MLSLNKLFIGDVRQTQGINLIIFEEKFNGSLKLTLSDTNCIDFMT